MDDNPKNILWGDTLNLVDQQLFKPVTTNTQQKMNLFLHQLTFSSFPCFVSILDISIELNMNYLQNKLKGKLYQTFLYLQQREREREREVYLDDIVVSK